MALQKISKEWIVRIIELTINLFCMLFVIYQSIQCISRYIEMPQGTKVFVSSSDKEPFPTFTLCPGYRSNSAKEDFLQNCSFNRLL